jgi:endonuclease/exonuclease/phosphatase family metal-dependent hydrolase
VLRSPRRGHAARDSIVSVIGVRGARGAVAASALAVTLIATPARLHAADATSAATAPPDTAVAGHSDDVVSVLSYNVHGLFRLAAKDDPRNRMPTIGWLANKYDVVLLQEDFEYPDVIAAQMQGAVQHRGNGIGGQPVLLLFKILAFPFTAPIPRFSPPYGSGLTTYVRERLDVPEAVARAPYDDCAGWVGQRLDCWSRKGWLRTRLRTTSGAEVDVYNTHIEAGADRRSVRSRRRNFETLASAIEEHSAGRAVVVGGDFNVDYSRPYDREIITAFRERTGLLDTSAAPELAAWRERDFILYRDGKRAKLSVLEAGEATEFVSGERALSDHPALQVTLRVDAAE